MSAAEATMERLEALVGSWRGTGTAVFPTTKDFVYDEDLRIAKATDRPALFYEQRATFREPSQAHAAGTHWESGFLRCLDDGTVELVNAQINGRLEVIRLKLTGLPGGFELQGNAEQFNDARMRGASRLYVLQGDQLRYSLSMSTTTVGAPTPHLDAKLHRMLRPSRP